MRSTAYVTVRPRYGLPDVIGLLFRELVLMILIFLAVFAIGAAAVLTIKKTYVAGASLYAGAGQEYVYQPRVGVTTERAYPPTPGEVAASEATILNSREVKLRVVRALGVAVFQDGKPSTAPMAKQEGDAIKAIDDGLTVSTAPLSAIIGLSYESKSADTSARVLNAIIDAYLTYRREVFQTDSSPADTQREAFEDELSDVDAAYERFLATNEIGDFATAKATAAATYQSVFTERLSVRAQLNQAARRLETLETQQAVTPAEIVLQQDLNVAAHDQIRQRRGERADLLARYQPDSQPILDIDARIAELEAYVAGGDTVGAKEVRTGPNPVWVVQESARINAAAERDSLAGRLAVLDQQVADLGRRQAQLTRLESENAILTGNRANVTASVLEFQQRGAQSRANNDLVRGGADSVRVIERAVAPSRGSSLKALGLGLVFLFAGFTALCVGLLRVFTRRGFSTPASAGRTLEMPVLAVAAMKAH